MKTTITYDLTISADFEFDQARQLQDDPGISTVPDAWREIIRKLDRTEAPLYIVSAYGVYVAGMTYLSERYILSEKDGLELDQSDPSEWMIFTDLDKAHVAAAETLFGEERPRQVSVVTITH